MQEFIGFNALWDLGRLKTRSDLECSSPAFNKHALCKKAKSTRCRFLTMFQFCSFHLEFLQGDACWMLKWSTPGSTLFSKLVIILFSECPIQP